MILLAVPNISEGRRLELVRKIAGSHTTLLDIDADPDHNRSVLTYGGKADELANACMSMIDRAVNLLDVTRHEGAHPRFGVVDVLPLVPYEATEADAIKVADQIAARAPMPVYRYTSDLPATRQRLRAPHPVHPTAGVLCLGVRSPLIAFNVNLRIEISRARAIARSARALPGVRALSFVLPSRDLTQVSMNLTDLDACGPRAAYEFVSQQAVGQVADAEIIGLIPGSIASQLVDIPLRRPARTVEQALGR